MQKETFPIPEDKKEEAILQSIHLNKIIIPIIIGIFTVAYLVWKQVEWKDLKNISWNGFTLFWLGIALVFLIVHHISYSFRLYSLSDKEFNFKK